MCASWERARPARRAGLPAGRVAGGGGEGGRGGRRHRRGQERRMATTANGQRRTANVLDPIDLAVMAHAFAGVAEEMGAALVASALSPNIRERRDSSAAVFDARGG